MYFSLMRSDFTKSSSLHESLEADELKIPRKRAQALEKCRIDYENRVRTLSHTDTRELTEGFDEIDSNAVKPMRVIPSRYYRHCYLFMQ